MARKPLKWGVRLAAVSVVMAAPLLFFTQAQAATAVLVGTGVTAPSGAVWVPGSLGGHWWVSDHIQGFCRLDVSGTSLVINGSTCSLAAVSPGQPVWDTANSVAYVPDNSSKSTGVVRFTMNPTSETIIDTAILAPGKGLTGNRATGLALGADGALYVSFLKNGSIVRVTTPAGDTATQQVQSVGSSSDNKRVLGLATFGSHLYLAETATLSRIMNVAACGGGCRATTLTTGAVSPTAISSDGTRLFVGDVTAVLRYNPATNVTETLANTGTYNGTTYPLSNVSTLGLDPAGTLLIGDDPTAGAGVLTGRLWTVDSNGEALPGGGGPPPPPPPPPPPGPNPITTATLAGTGLTAPAGLVWIPGSLGGHWWVADHIQGFCRLDASGTALVINSTTCSLAAVSPGQPYFDVTHSVVYVPDNSAKSQGVVRLTINGAAETVQNSAVLAPNKGLGGNRPSAVTVGSDGALYVTFLKNGSVSRVTNPAGDPATQNVQSVGSSSDGKRVLGVASFGSDLYLAETAAVSRITGVSACTGGCKGTTIAAGAITPGAIVADGTRLFIGDATGVFRYTPASGVSELLANSGVSNATVYPLSNVSALGLDPAGTLLVGDDPTAGAGVLTGRVWTVNANA